MNDCLWFAMGVCRSGCKCSQYLSMNSDEGARLGQEWEERVERVLEPMAFIFAKEKGFGGSEHEM